MKLTKILCLLFLASPGLTVALGKTAPAGSPRIYAARNHSLSTNGENIFNLADFGAVGDGVTDDGPALQNALNAIGEAGGGTLFVPAGRYALITPVQKDFTGLASDISILGVESLTPVPPANSNGQELTRGLDLLSEFAPRTGEQGISINITGLQSFLIKDITFIGTPGVITDALITVALNDISDATIRHCEFYGLRSVVEGGDIVLSVRSHLKVEQSVFLGSTSNSAVNTSVIQNIEWKGITIADTVFVDYGQRAELYGKLDLAAPYSWVNIGNTAAPESDSPRREAVIRNVFFDEGALSGLSSVPYRYLPASAPIDLLYVSGMYMNVSNLGTSGNYLYGPVRVLIENSHYGWSHNADSAINLLSVGNAILDQVECGASADRIRADSATGNLTVIDSVYNHLDSLAQTTRVITTNAPDEDPVQYVRQQFSATLGRDPDPAAHFYWSDQILQCGDNSQCADAKRAALGDYLAAAPQEKFAVSGRVVDENGAGMAGVKVALGGSQNVTTETDADGRYQFSNLPTSGVYTVIPSRRHYTLSPVSYEIVTPAADQIFNSAAIFNHHAIGGRVADGAGNALADVTVTLSGSQSMTATTAADGEYLFEDLPAGGNYTVTPRKTSYAFSPANRTLNDLDADQSQNFAGTFVTYTIAGILVGVNNNPIPGATFTLSGSQNRTTTSDSGGEFSFSGVPSEGNYTVTPTLIGFSFNPSSRTYNALAANQYHAYVATFTTHSISGRVTHSGGTALSGALVTLSGNTSATTTDANGNYNFPSLARGGDYTLTVSKTHYTFSQPSRTFNNLTSNQTADFASTLNVHSISGRVTVGQTSLSGVIVTLSGSQSATATTDVNGNYSFTVFAGGSYTVVPTKTTYLFSPATMTFNDLSGNQGADFGATLQRLLEFSAASYSVSEDTRTITVTVTRSGDTSGAAEVIYSATDGSAEQRSDVIPVIGRLSFAPNETSKTFIIFITDDAYVEGNESITLELGNLVGGILGNNSTATLTITDNDSGATSANPIDGAQFFVRQHYRDFLNRPADADGLAFWSNQILSCGTDAACIADRRMNVSAAFFLSIEFQETGFLVYRLYQASFAQPPQHLDEFLLDTRTIGEGVVVNAPGWQELLETNKTAFIEDFVARSEFSQAYPLSLTPAEFVNLLNSKTGGALSPNDVAAAVAEFQGAATSDSVAARARALGRVAENETFSQRQLNPAFVLMEYFGYLQRNPNEAPDTNLDGYNFWLRKLDEFGGDFRRAEMVKSFLVSSEYRARFGAP